MQMTIFQLGAVLDKSIVEVLKIKRLVCALIDNSACIKASTHFL